VHGQDKPQIIPVVHSSGVAHRSPCSHARKAGEITMSFAFTSILSSAAKDMTPTERT
jgi:hypothetical protein